MRMACFRVIGFALDAVAFGVEKRETVPQMVLVDVQHVWITRIILVSANQVAIPDTNKGVDILIGKGDDAISSGSPALLQLGLH
jgi:hypothetical protein